MSRDWLFAATIVVVFVLGIGANAVMFGIVDRLLLRAPGHIEAPEQVKRVLVERGGALPGERSPDATLSYPVLRDMASVPGVAAVAGYQSRREFLGRHESATEIPITLVSGSYFDVLGPVIQMGRALTPADDKTGAPPSAVISHGMWQRHFGGAESVLGEVLDLDGVDYTIVGVAKPGFTGMDLERTDAWVPLRAANSNTAYWEGNRRFNWLSVVVRLEPEAEAGGVATVATGIHHNAHRELAEQGRYDPQAHVVLASAIPGRGPDASGESRVAQWLLLVSMLVLVIASANMANLLLARSIRSQRETGVRLALGAPRGRLVVEGILDGLLPAALGAALALVAAEWAGGVVRSLLLPEVAWHGGVIDLRLLGFVAALTLLSGAVAGLLPTLRSAAADVRGVLADGGRTATGPAGWGKALGVLQTALSAVLLVGAALFLGSLGEARQTRLGFETEGLLVSRPVLDTWWEDDAERDRFFAEALRRVEQLPGVSSASGAGMTTPFGAQLFLGLTRGGEALPEDERNAFVTGVTADYFRTLGQEVLQGRPILETDQASSAPVVVVSQSMARRLWSDGDPLGRCLAFEGFREDVTCAEVVGVVADAHRRSLEESNLMHAYIALPQKVVPWGTQNVLFVRARPGADVQQVSDAVRRQMLAALPRLRYATVTPLRDLIDPLAGAWKLGATLFTLFGALAIAIASFGLYSLLAFEVSQQRREIAIRTALGATRRRLLGGIIRRAVSLTAVGLALGFGLVAVAAPRFAELLFRTNPLDPGALAAVAAVLLGSAFAAAALPGRTAIQAPPRDVLNAP